jgi:hypothetical protein
MVANEFTMRVLKIPDQALSINGCIYPVLCLRLFLKAAMFSISEKQVISKL